MKRFVFAPLLAAMLLALAGAQAEAGLFCGMGRFRCCPSDSCKPCGDYGSARACSSPCYKNVYETVWCTEEYVDQCTVYDTCVERVPICCNRTVYDTCYRDECYTVCTPGARTGYADCCCTVRVPHCQTCYRTVCCTVRKPCYNTCYRDVCYTVCRPCYQTCYRDCCYTVKKPCYQTWYKTIQCTEYK